MSIITANEVQSILNKWLVGELNESQVHAWAESRFCVDEYESETEAVNEVLARLDTIDMNLTTKDDIPAFLVALFSEYPSSVLDDHDKKVNIDFRRKELKNNPFYSRFC